MTDRPPVAGQRACSSGVQPLGVVVVSTDPGRMSQYRAALRMAGVNAALTSDTDEAEGWLRDRLPAALILDQGLPRMTVFRLYGLIRDSEWAQGISVLFVGQEGEGGPGDCYLPADASPLAVAEQAQGLAAGVQSISESPGPQRSSPPRAEVIDVPAQPVGPTGEPPRPRPAPAVAVADVPADPAATEPAEVEEAPVAGSGRRLDVILFRVGLVLLILGAALVFLRPEPSSSPAVAPARRSPPRRARLLRAQAQRPDSAGWGWPGSCTPPLHGETAPDRRRLG